MLGGRGTGGALDNCGLSHGPSGLGTTPTLSAKRQENRARVEIKLLPEQMKVLTRLQLKGICADTIKITQFSKGLSNVETKMA